MDEERFWHILIYGLKVPPEPRDLAPGVTLRPIRQRLTMFDIAAAGAAGLPGWSVLGSLSHGCVAEIEAARSHATAPGYDVLNRAWLASALLVLRGFTKHLCLASCSVSWNTVAGYAKTDSQDRNRLDHLKGGLLDFHVATTINKSARSDVVGQADIDWVYEHFETFNTLAAESESFRFSLESATAWRFAKDSRLAVAGLWSGIEAFFAITSELVYRLSLLSACLLAERGEARKQKFDQVKKLYGLRSKVVHGEKVSPEKMEEAVDESFQLLADLLVLTINTGHVLGQADFDRAVFE